MEVDLEADWESQLAAIKALSIRATIYMSYAVEDSDIAASLAHALRQNDYRVLSDRDLSPGTNWQQTLKDFIDYAVAHGFVLLVLSPDVFHRRHVTEEIEYALDRYARVVPVVIRDYETTMSLLLSRSTRLAGIQCLDLSEGDALDRARRLISVLRNIERT